MKSGTPSPSASSSTLAGTVVLRRVKLTVMGVTPDRGLASKVIPGPGVAASGIVWGGVAPGGGGGAGVAPSPGAVVVPWGPAVAVTVMVPAAAPPKPSATVKVAAWDPAWLAAGVK